MGESIDRLPQDVADRKVFWAGSILLARALEQGKAQAQVNAVDVEVEILRMESAPTKSNRKD